MFSRYYFSKVSSNCGKLLGLQVKEKFLSVLLNPEEGCPISWDPGVRYDAKDKDTLFVKSAKRTMKCQFDKWNYKAGKPATNKSLASNNG